MSDITERRVVMAAGISRRSAGFLVGVGAWSWVIWPTFLRNIWQDERSFDDGPTRFLIVHAVLTAVSLAVGTITAAIGIRALRNRP